MNGLDKVIEHLNHAHLDALLNPPTDDMILEHLKKEMGHIPADYIEFLKRCNGLTLYHTETIAYLMLRKFFRSILVMIIYYVGRHGKLDIGWDMILSLTWMT